jgi:SAM-dependent methyltransferase
MSALYPESLTRGKEELVPHWIQNIANAIRRFTGRLLKSGEISCFDRMLAAETIMRMLPSVCRSSLALALGLISMPAAMPAATNTARANIPYVPTRHDTVRDLLWLADVGTNDVVYDLGSGDGRIVIAAVRDFHARKAVGLEIKSELVRESRTNAARSGITNRVEFIQGDLFQADYRDATVAVLYLGHDPNFEMRARLVSTLRPGARIVSHQFGMGEWQPDKQLDVRTPYFGMYSEAMNPFGSNTDTPDYRIPFDRVNHRKLSAWIVPAPVAGTWRGKLQMSSGPADFTLTLHQRLSGVSGTFQLEGATNLIGGVQADIWGTNLRLHCTPTNRWGYGSFLMWFDGQATNDTLKGDMFISIKGETHQTAWTGQREKSDLTGTWTWSGPMGRAVELKVEHRNGRLTATYHDPSRPLNPYEKNPPVAVTDIYDFGGGLYFTLLLGREGSSRRLGPEDGWLIGEGIAGKFTLEGTVAFYPYPERERFFDPIKRQAEKPTEPAGGKPIAGRQDWLARRFQPGAQ